MKILKNAFVVLMCSFVFMSGCEIFDGTFKDEPESVSVTGILTEQSELDDRAGSHLLTDEDGEEYLIRSTAINLSSDKYLGNKVTLMGAMDDEDDVLVVTGVSVLEVLVEPSGDNDLKKYKNTDLGFELKYYGDWKAAESVDEVVFSSPTETGYSDKVVITQFPYSYDSSSADAEESALNSYFKERYPEVTDFDSISRKIGVDGLDAIFLEKDDELAYYLYRNGLIYKLSYEPESGESEDNKRVFMEMVSTFNFLGFTVEADSNGNIDSEIDSASNGVTGIPDVGMEMSFFESAPYFFKASYPKSWYYSGESSSDPGVLHTYALSDEPVEDDNILISLEVLNTAIPSDAGFLHLVSPNPIAERSQGGLVEFYVNVADRIFRISGDEDYRDLMLNIAASIEHLEKKESE